MTPDRKCSSCVAFFPQEGRDTGECRRFPKSITTLIVPQQDSLGRVVPAVQTVSNYPLHRPEEYCLEWRPEVKLAH